MNDAEAAWLALPRETRKEVARLAKRGQRHAQADVATVAQTWATETLHEHVGLGVALDILLGGLTGTGGSSGQLIARRRLAKQLLRLSLHATDG